MYLKYVNTVYFVHVFKYKIQNTFWMRFKYKIHRMYFKYVFEILIGAYLKYLTTLLTKGRWYSTAGKISSMWLPLLFTPYKGSQTGTVEDCRSGILLHARRSFCYWTRLIQYTDRPVTRILIRWVVTFFVIFCSSDLGIFMIVIIIIIIIVVVAIINNILLTSEQT